MNKKDYESGYKDGKYNTISYIITIVGILSIMFLFVFLFIDNNNFQNKKDNFCLSKGMEHKYIDKDYCIDKNNLKLYSMIDLGNQEYYLAKEVVTLE